MSRRKPIPPPFAARLSVTHFGRGGDAVASQDGEPVFVPFALPGEMIDALVRPHPKFPTTAKITEIITASPDRQVPPCPHFGPDAVGGNACGGCALQHVNEDAYRAYKLGLLTHQLQRADLTPETLHPLAVSPPGSRRRVVLSGERWHNGTLHFGFNARGGPHLVNLQVCVISRPEIVALIAPLRALLDQLLQPGDKCDAAITWFPQGCDVVLLGLPRVDWQGREAIAQLARECGLSRISIRARKIKEREPVAQLATPTCTFGDLTVAPPAGSFLQATLEGEAAMVAAVQSGLDAYIPQAKRFADLFCGCGTFSGVLAQRGQVVAVEFEGESLEALRNANHPNIHCRAGDLMAEPMTPAELNTFDAVLFDPPRAGAKVQAEELAKSKVRLVIAVSCNPETFVRDARCLTDAGYRLRDIWPVDQFRWSPHLELVAAFTR